MARGRNTTATVKIEPLPESEASETPRRTRARKNTLPPVRYVPTDEEEPTPSVSTASETKTPRTRGRKSAAATPKATPKAAAKTPKATAKSTPKNAVKTTPASRKRALQPSTTEEESPSAPASNRNLTLSGKRGRPKKSEFLDKKSVFVPYFKDPYQWFILSTKEKTAIVDNEANKVCPKCQYDLSGADAVDHLEECILPRYYTFIGRFPDFRALEEEERRKLVVSATTGSRAAPCLDMSCGGAYRGASGLGYHIARCGLAVDQVPWVCHRCKYEGVKAESSTHLKECRNREANEKDAVRDAIIAVLKEAEAIGHTELTEKLQTLRGLEGDELLEALGVPHFKDFVFIDAAKQARLFIETDYSGTPSRLSMGGGVAPKSHSRLSVRNGVSRFKFRNVAVTNGKSNPYNVYEYTLAVRRSREAFCAKLGQAGVIQLLRSVDAPDWTVQNIDEDPILQKWLNRSSIKMDVRSTTSQRAILDSNVILNNRNASLSTFKSRSYPFTLHGKVQKNLLVHAIADRVEAVANSSAPGDMLKVITNDPANKEQYGAALVVGGPVLAIRTAPQKAADGSEVVVISTAIDEVTWEHPLTTPTYLQFWKYTGNELGTEPTLWFLLRLDGVGTIADVAWCPFFTESILVNAAMYDSDVLGYIAVTTDVGRVIGYRIEKDYDFAYEAVDDNLPPVISLTPSFVLETPVCVVVEPMSDDCGVDVEGYLRTIKPEPMEHEVSFLETSGRRRSGVTSFAELFDSDDDGTARPKKKQLKRAKKEDTDFTEANAEEEEEEEEDEDEEVATDAIEATEDDATDASSPKRKKKTKKTPVKKGDRDLIVNPKKKKKRTLAFNDDDEDSIAGGDEEPEGLFIERAVVDAPLIAIDWSVYSQCRKIAAVSASGFVHFWDLGTISEDEESDKVTKPYANLCDEAWEAPPNSVKWINEDAVAIGFRNRMVIYYQVSTLRQLYSDATNRSAGHIVGGQQITFPGTFSFDSVRVVPVAGQIPYPIGMYQVLDMITNTGLVLSLPNRHFGQCFDLSICENSGVLASVGVDGRLVESLNGRITPRGENQDFACAIIRPIFQLVRHRIPHSAIENPDVAYDTEAEPLAPPPLVEHDLLTKSAWLEVRFGDAVDPVVDNTIEIDRATFDRRIETLTRVEFSRHSPGVALVGGEAGVVFIVPTSL
uniref:RING-type domain-containing protein n=1 Tax=Panagrellus redivivus TaxID=6233 RepID=A0A7E4W2S8_PANRE